MKIYDDLRSLGETSFDLEQNEIIPEKVYFSFRLLQINCVSIRKHCICCCYCCCLPVYLFNLLPRVRSVNVEQVLVLLLVPLLLAGLLQHRQDSGLFVVPHLE